MKRFCVQVPLAGYFGVEVEANSEEEAKSLAMEHNPFEDEDIAEIEEVDFFEEICMGNVFYGPLNRIEVEELDD